MPQCDEDRMWKDGQGTLIYSGHMVISHTEGAFYPCLWKHLLLLAWYGFNQETIKGKLEICVHFNVMNNIITPFFDIVWPFKSWRTGSKMWQVYISSCLMMNTLKVKSSTAPWVEAHCSIILLLWLTLNITAVLWSYNRPGDMEPV